MDYVVCRFYINPQTPMRGIAIVPADRARIVVYGTVTQVIYRGQVNPNVNPNSTDRLTASDSRDDWANYNCHFDEAFEILPAKQAVLKAETWAKELNEKGHLLQEPM